MQKIKALLVLYSQVMLAGVLVFGLASLFESGLPKSLVELMMRLTGAGLVSIFLYATLMSPAFRVFMIGACLALLLAINLIMGLHMDAWAALSVSAVLSFVLLRACMVSHLVRMVSFAAVIAVLASPFVVVALRPLPAPLQVALAVVFLVAIGAGAARLWRRIEAWMRGWSGLSPKKIARESAAEWRRTAAGPGEISADDFLKPSKKASR